MPDSRYREYLLDRFVAAAKFPRERKAYWRDRYNNDPEGTMSLIDKLAPGLPAAETPSAAAAPYPAELFPELRQRRPHGNVLASGGVETPTHPAAAAPPEPGNASQGLAEALFPELRARKNAAPSRIIKADD